jgi:hypothetical protein
MSKSFAENYSPKFPAMITNRNIFFSALNIVLHSFKMILFGQIPEIKIYVIDFSCSASNCPDPRYSCTLIRSQEKTWTVISRMVLQQFVGYSSLLRDGQSGPGTSTKIFSEQDRDQNVFFWAGTVTKIFLTETGTKMCFWKDRDRDLKLFPAGTGTETKIFFSPGPGRIFFLTGTKNDWSRSCLSLLLFSFWYTAHVLTSDFFNTTSFMTLRCRYPVIPKIQARVNATTWMALYLYVTLKNRIKLLHFIKYHAYS